jgi:hypothetical protein
MAIRRTLAALCVVCAVTAAAAFQASQARGDDRAATESMLQEAERDPARKAATADVVKRAREALERATRLRSAGDETHAKLADGLAKELAETARDLGRTVDAERQAAEARRAALDAGAQAERDRALLEEGIAQNGRLRAELAQAEHAGKEAPPKTNAAGAAAAADAGSGGSAAPAAPAKGGTKPTPKPESADGGVK